MKSFGIFLLVAIAVASSQGSIDVGRISKRAVSATLESVVEEVREILINGNDSLGIPPAEPLEVETLAFDIDNDYAVLQGSLEDLRIDGLTGFVANTLTFSLIGVKFTYCFNWETINVSSKYSVDGTAASVIPVYGSGDFAADLTDLNVCGTISLSTSGGYLYIRDSTVALTLGGVEVKVTGLLNDDEISQLVTDIANDMIPQLLTDFETQINSAVNEVIVTVGNQFLGTMTLSELIAMVM